MEVRFNATEKQGLMLQYWQDDITTEIGFGGAAGGGKSMGGVFAVRSSCMKYPGSKRVFGRKELVNLKRTTLATYYKMLKQYNIPQQYYGVLNGNTNIIKFPNGSEIVLLDCASQPSDPEFTRFGSLELTGAFIDESNEVDAKGLMILKTRLGRQNTFEINGEKIKIKPKLLETFNPNKGHVYEDYYKPRKDGTLPEHRKFIPALAKDNPYLTEDYIRQLERSDEMTKQRLLYGNFEYDDTPGKVFRWDEISDLFTNIIEKDETPYITCDVARLGNDRTIIYVWNGLESVLIKEFKGYTTDQTANVIKDLEQQYRVSRYNICVDSDGVGGGVADQLRGCVNFMNNGQPIVEDGEIRNYGNLKAQCYFKLKEVMEKRMIRVNASGQVKEDIQRELDNIIVKNMDSDQKIRLESKEDMKKRLGGNSPDYADALMMRMYWLLKRKSSPIEKTEVYTINFDDMLY